MRPVGSTSRRPRVGAPEGPGATKRPGEAARRAAISLGPQARRAGRISFSICLQHFRSLAAVMPAKAGIQLCLADESGTPAFAGVTARSDVANSSSRSTVSPLLRHGSVVRACRSFGLRASPRLAHVAGQRIEIAEAEIVARARISDWSPPSPRPRGTRVRATSRSVSRRPSGELPKDVQAVADLGFLQVAEIGVEPLQVAVVIAGEAGVEIEARGSGEVEDVALQGRRCGGGRGRRPGSIRRPALRGLSAGHRFRRGSAAASGDR